MGAGGMVEGKWKGGIGRRGRRGNFVWEVDANNLQVIFPIWKCLSAVLEFTLRAYSVSPWDWPFSGIYCSSYSW